MREEWEYGNNYLTIYKRNAAMCRCIYASLRDFILVINGQSSMRNG